MTLLDGSSFARTHPRSRYGNPKFADPEAKHFARDFRTSIAPQLLGPMMDSLALRARGQYCSDRVTHLALMCVVLRTSVVWLAI